MSHFFLKALVNKIIVSSDLFCLKKQRFGFLNSLPFRLSDQNPSTDVETSLIQPASFYCCFANLLKFSFILENVWMENISILASFPGFDKVCFGRVQKFWYMKQTFLTSLIANNNFSSISMESASCRNRCYYHALCHSCSKLTYKRGQTK